MTKRTPIAAATLAVAGAVTYAVVALTGGTSGISFRGDFENGLTPWHATPGGGAQCANTGVPSSGTHYRGTLAFDKTNPGQGTTAGRFYLAAQSTYPLEVCDIITGPQVNTVPSDGYYGLMVRVPVGYTIGGFGNNIWGLHFDNVWTAPVNLVAWSNHVAVTIETGACTPVGSGHPGCAYRNGKACTVPPAAVCLPPKDLVPVGSFTGGKWYELVVHARWAADQTGLVQTWWRTKGTTTWHVGGGYSGIPTEQWTAGKAVPTRYIDEIASYTAKLSSPLTIWLDNQVAGTSFAAVTGAMP